MGFKSWIWDKQYQLFRKTVLHFLKTWSSLFWVCVHSFWRFLYKSLKIVGQCHQNQSTFLLKWRWGRPKVFVLSCAWFVSLVVNEKAVEKFEINVREFIPIFVRLQCWVLPALVFEGYVYYFGSLHPAFEMSCDMEYLWKRLLFLEQNGNFPKRRWVRSKNVFLSSARLDSLVVTKKDVLRTCWDLSTWNNTCFLFKCRVKFWLGWLSEATFGTLVFLRRVFDISYRAN